MKLLWKKDEAKQILLGWKLDALQHFEDKMTNRYEPFPCIPATQAFSLGHLRYGFVGALESDITPNQVTQILKEYSEGFRQFGKFTTLIVFFKTENITNLTVEKYEQMYWRLLNELTANDEKAWPEHIPEDPHDATWEFCFHGEPYFMYCATPAHKQRNSRAFPYFILAITPRWTLQQFNASADYAEKVKGKIRQRLENYDQITPHPELRKYGEHDNYEWKQYFLHDDDTVISNCPFLRRQQVMRKQK
ncbi:YqcI/YcgG family protein [Alkalihalobacillus sp. BA299]|uniref:YqcI/YcgG family protein n=1 Tax=Alkalihalobacillus sp. BA299 TaxID=2815938 RepID=UPI0027DCA524|nr:YqcI/YcgG family protein [Alkalihalobacillus sp. BA299]